MTSFGLSDQQLALLKQAISQFNEIQSAWIFGSRAMGNDKPGSDVDLAIKGPKITETTVSTLSALLNEELPLPQFFDVIHYESLDAPSLTEHIDAHAIQL